MDMHSVTETDYCIRRDSEITHMFPKKQARKDTHMFQLSDESDIMNVSVVTFPTIALHRAHLGPFLTPEALLLEYI